MIANKYLIIGGAVLALALVGGVYLYGSHREDVGYERREAEVQKEVAKRNIEVFNEHQRLQAERDTAELQYVNLKNTTDIQLAARDNVTARLRVTTNNAIRERDEAIAAGRVDANEADWIGAFAACYSEYGMLGADAASIADNYRGLQLYQQSQSGTLKPVPAPGK